MEPLTSFDPAGLDAALAGHQVVKSTLIRITLHAVHADDHRVFRAAMEPSLRGARLGDRRFTASGLSAADADALVPELLTYADQPRTAARTGGAVLSRPLEEVVTSTIRHPCVPVGVNLRRDLAVRVGTKRKITPTCATQLCRDPSRRGCRLCRDHGSSGWREGVHDHGGV